MPARYILTADDRVDPTDRGLAYGDGIFETMRVVDGRVVRLASHLDRLKLGAARLELPLPEATELTDRIRQAGNGIDRGTLKLIVTRGPGRRGYAPPEHPSPSVILLADRSSPRPSRTITLCTLTQRLGENEKLAGIKHLNRLEQILGRLELSRLGTDEGLMLSSSGSVIGGTSRNLFLMTGGRLKTPAVTRAGIAGVMRRAVIEQSAELDIEVVEENLTLDAVEHAEEIFMTNALVGIQSVTHFNSRPLAGHAVADRLRATLES